MQDSSLINHMYKLIMHAAQYAPNKGDNEQYLLSILIAKIDNKTFCKILQHTIKDYDRNPVGTPDYIVWNNKEMTFVEVKRKNETLKSEQMEWGEFLIKNKIPYKVLRVLPQ